MKILDEGNRIKLMNITATDNGIYSCRAENVGGAVDSTNNFLLNVKGELTKHPPSPPPLPHPLSFL